MRSIFSCGTGLSFSGYSGAEAWLLFMPRPSVECLKDLQRISYWPLLLLVMLPLSQTMALIWKTKEVVLESVFGSHR